MSLNIIDLIKGQLGPALISQAATQLGESESGISKAISGLLPTVVGGMANNAKNPAVLDAVATSHSSGMLNNLLGSTADSSSITMLLSSIFGDKTGGVINGVSSFAGINSSSVTSLLSMVTGAIIGSVGKYAADNNLDKSGISSLLEDQKGIVSSLLPAGLSMTSLGLGNIFGGGESEKVTVSTPTTPVTPVNPVRTTPVTEPKVDVTREGATHVKVDNEPNGGGSIWKWLLPLLLALAVGYFIWTQYGKDKNDVDPVTTEQDSAVNANQSTDTLNGATTMNRVDEDIDLNGTMIKGYRGGMEDNMIQFLKANKYKDAVSDAELKDTWYNFDKVNFEMASSDQLLEGSDEQMKNLVAILKAYPGTKIKIGGYTDNVGDAAVNKDLSQKRADFLKNKLTEMGVGSQVTGAEGYGSEMATVPATASDEERSVDRNMAVRFTK